MDNRFILLGDNNKLVTMSGSPPPKGYKNYIAYANSPDGVQDFLSMPWNENLLPQSRLDTSSGHFIGHQNVVLENKDGDFLRVTCPEGSEGTPAIQLPNPKSIASLVEGETYTISFDIRSSSVEWYAFRHSTDESFTIFRNIGTSWQRVSASWVIPPTTDPLYIMFYTAVAGQYFDIKNVKIEKGSTATPWQPHLSKVQDRQYIGLYQGLDVDSLEVINNPSKYRWINLDNFIAEETFKQGEPLYISALASYGDEDFTTLRGSIISPIDGTFKIYHTSNRSRFSSIIVDTRDYSGLLEPHKPSVYDGVLEYEEVIKAEGEVLYYAHEALQNILLSQKLSTMPIDTIISYEGIFGIIGNPDTETLEFRRQRIINRLSLKPPFSMEFLESRLDEIIGAGRWAIDYDKDNFTLYIESSASDQQWATELSITINSIKPANIVYVNVPAIFSKLYANSTSGYSQNTANYVAGLWVVGQKDIVSYSDKGEIVMATTLTMTDAMMELMLEQLKDNIVADFYLNDSVVKPATKTINSATNQLVSTCELLASDGITNLKKVVLRNASGQALDIHNVSVPVLDGITLKHTLTIGEGAK